MLLAALAPELEAQGGAVDVHVLVAQGGEPKGVVLFGVLLVADPDEGRLQQLDHRGEHLLPPQAAPRHVLLEPLADLGQGLAEGDHAPELGLVAHLPPFGVVAVLLAPAGVAPGRLQVAVRAGADPDVRPGRRDGQLAGGLQGLLVPARAALRVDVGEALAALLAADAGLVVRDIAQACGLGALDRIDEHGDGQTRIELLALVDGDGSRHESHLCRVSGTSLQQLPTDVPRRQEKQPFFAAPRPQEPPSSSASPMPTVMDKQRSLNSLRRIARRGTQAAPPPLPRARWRISASCSLNARLSMRRVPAPAPLITHLQISQGTAMSTTMSASAVLSEPRLSGPSRVSRPRERCIVVSDRLPIALTREEGQGWRVAPARGALISALTAVLGDRRGVWIGWPGVAQEETPGLRRVLAGAIHAGGLSLRPVMLTAEERRNACGGFSGEVIWPLFHGLTEEHNFQPAYWQAFRKVNRKFARATARTLARGASANDLVWVHEPLLLNLARELRGLKAGCRTAFFLHLPFPTPDLYLRLPWREELLGGLLAFDQAGFQTELDLANFLACVRMLAPGVAVAPAGGGLWSLHGSWQGSAVGLGARAFPVGL